MADVKDKYAGLPDLDEGPDIFDTPELTDDTSTAPPASATDDGDASEHIDRQNLDRREARARFTGSRVSATDADFSDRINGERRSYQVRNRRRRRRATVTETEEDEEDDWTEDEDPTPEGMRRRLARLTREAAELKSELERTKEEGDEASLDGLDKLDEDLALLNKSILKDQESASQRLQQKLTPRPRSQPGAVAQDVASAERPANTTETSTVQLQQAASFETRLALLEGLLGADPAALASMDSSTYRKPVLPTLDMLDKQLATLTSTSAANLDSVQKRVQALTRETERLEEARRAAKEAQESLSSPRAGATDARVPSSDQAPSALEDPEQVAKINALHGTLPTIESLAPILPGLLARLRSLRLLHADAANASASLTELERRQDEVDTELKEWRESLEKLEEQLGKTETTTKKNMKVVDDWVKDITERVRDLEEE